MPDDAPVMTAVLLGDGEGRAMPTTYPAVPVPPTYDSTQMTKSTYRIDPVRDLTFAREFMAAPVGLHSPGLQRVLNVLRGEPLTGKYVLIEVTPHEQWQLGRLTGERGRPVEVLDTFFTDLTKAEREVFLLRWKEHVGADLDLAAC